MIDPLFWLGLSIALVAVSLTAVLVAALPTLQELARAARSAEKLFDTLRRDLPPTLEAIRLTGLEISDLTDDVSDGVKSASQVVKQVDQSFDNAKKQAKNVELSTRSVFTGVKAAWKSFIRPSSSNRRKMERLATSQRTAMPLQVRSSDRTSVSQGKPQALGDDVLASLEQQPLSPPYYDSDTDYEAGRQRTEDPPRQTKPKGFEPTSKD